MSEVVAHECPDGRKFRINMIQEIREQPLVKGVSYAFQVDSDEGEGAPAVDGGGAGSFDVAVSFAPIFVSISTPQGRRDLYRRAVELVAQLRDRGHHQQAELRITSDGAAKLGDNVIGRLFPFA